MLQYLRNGVVCSCDVGSGGGGGAAAADVAAEDPGGAGGGGGSDGGGGTAAALKLGGGGPPAQKGGGGGSGPGMFTFEEFMNDKNEGSERVRELSQEVDVDVGDEVEGGEGRAVGILILQLGTKNECQVSIQNYFSILISYLLILYI